MKSTIRLNTLNNVEFINMLERGFKTLTTLKPKLFPLFHWFPSTERSLRIKSPTRANDAARQQQCLFDDMLKDGVSNPPPPPPLSNLWTPVAPLFTSLHPT
ncbi:hypothetical protein NPIL_440341 [Nephila pilipes]|uniref:Uncharacterized protein n=1 Tax=Nephila pilipes TaxID=299642 RepID=A0A8X6NH36_NEPPI|nr:hypothetical protein NPIL_440341 [Nephila pilipes]